MSTKSDYERARGGKLKLKGNKTLFKADKTKRKKTVKNTEKQIDPDITAHGGWRRIKEESELTGGISIALECGNGSNCYLAALDNGRFTIGGPHLNGESPNPEEVGVLIIEF
ncbi:unnamed protein product [Anisakis simplex]|uniref:Protein FRG1 homolog (inferred by orthology to a C. elegans protein) n=1 Tax=Anisakis simplex TaxID=6269 RepID=A0A0M3JDW9_ANISI|nr:unnamed protein product [Anisakis simplex]